MKAPETYFEWREMLARFGKGDDTVIQFLNDGKMNLDAGTAGRFYQLINETYTKRKQLWSDKFKTITQNQMVRTASDMNVYINQAKSSLRALIVYSRMNSLSPEVRKMLQDDLANYIGGVKKSLKENALRDRGNMMGPLLLVIDNFDVHKVETSMPPTTTQQPDNSIPNKRRIIF